MHIPIVEYDHFYHVIMPFPTLSVEGIAILAGHGT